MIDGEDVVADANRNPMLRGHAVRTGAAAVGAAGLAFVLTFRSSLRWPRLLARGEPQDISVARERAGEPTMSENTAEPSGLAPGHYTRETLPPPRPGVAKILAQVRRDAEMLEGQSPAIGSKLGKLAKGESFTIAPTDRGKTTIRPTDKGKRAIRIT